MPLDLRKGTSRSVAMTRVFSPRRTRVGCSLHLSINCTKKAAAKNGLKLVKYARFTDHFRMIPLERHFLIGIRLPPTTAHGCTIALADIRVGRGKTSERRAISQQAEARKDQLKKASQMTPTLKVRRVAWKRWHGVQAPVEIRMGIPHSKEEERRKLRWLWLRKRRSSLAGCVLRTFTVATYRRLRP